MTNQNSSKVVRLSLILGCLVVAIGFLKWGGVFSSATQRNATVQGTVTIDGELASSGTVTFHPANGGPVAIGQIHEDGGYSLSIGRGTEGDPEKDTIFSGDYVVTVVVTGPSDKQSVVEEGGPPLAGPRLVAMKYASKETSELKFNVKPGRNLFALPVEGVATDQVIEGEDATEDDSEEKTVESTSEPQESDSPTDPGEVNEANGELNEVAVPAGEEAKK